MENINKSSKHLIAMGKTYHVIIEKDEDGFVGTVPELRGCLSQGDTKEELLENIKDAIQLCLEVQKEDASMFPVIDVETVTV